MDQHKVVILEDEQTSLMLLKEVLEKHGYAVEATFESGEAYLQQAAKLKSNILFVDIKLAGKKTGIQVVQELPNREEFCIVYLTSNTNETIIDNSNSTLPLWK